MARAVPAEGRGVLGAAGALLALLLGCLAGAAVSMAVPQAVIVVRRTTVAKGLASRLHGARTHED
jgi:hypothetical protein